MSSLWSFFAYEMRRNLPVLPVGLVAAGVMALPALRGLATDLGVEDRRMLAAAGVLFLLVPVLALYVAGNAWLRERSEGTLRWLYARPLSGSALFAVRLAAMVVTLGVFVALTHAVIGVSPWAFLNDPVLWTLNAAPLLVFLPALVPATAVWVSACAPGRGWGFPLLATVLVASWLLPTAAGGLLPMPVILFEQSQGLETAVAVLRYGVFPLLLLAGAWWATRRAVADPRPRRQAMVGTAVAAVTAVLLVALGASVSAWTAPARVVWERSLAGGTTLRLIEGKGLEEGVARLGLGGVGALDVWTRAWIPPIVAPDGRNAVLRDALEWGAWVMVGSDGTVLDLGKLEADPMGWSPGGERFAFLCRKNQRGVESLCSGARRPILVLVGRRGSLRTLPLPGLDDGFFHVQWLDGEHLMVVESTGAADGAGTWTQRWGVLSIAEVTTRWSRPVEARPAGQELSTAYAVFRAALFPGSPAPRRDGRLLLWRGAGSERELVALDPEGWRLRVLTVRPRRATVPDEWYHPESLGTLDDGTAVWVERDAGAYRVMALPPAGDGLDGAVRPSCRFPGGDWPGRFLGQMGSRAVWSPGRRLLLCDLDSGETRVIDDLGPGVYNASGVEVTARGIRAPQGRWIVREGG